MSATPFFNFPTSAAAIELSASMQNSKEVVNATYRPLQKKDREVRLVVLELAIERSMPITCRLEVVKLCDEPIYEALSWNWGDPNDNDELILEGRR
jgi:hypothetical protein